MNLSNQLMSFGPLALGKLLIVENYLIYPLKARRVKSSFHRCQREAPLFKSCTIYNIKSCECE